MKRKRRFLIGAAILFVAVLAAGSGAWIWLWSGGPLVAGKATAEDLAAADSGFGADTFTPFVFLHFGDPQVGRTDLAAEQERFAEAIRQANELKPAFVVIAGDLVETDTWSERIAFRQALRRLEVPVLLVPGNHDLPDDAARRFYLRRYGREMYTVVYNNCAFICLNSELSLGDLGEGAARQWSFLERALAEANQRNRTHIFVVQHRPPFRGAEPDADRASSDSRAADARRLVDLARRHGVRAFLCGHTHTTEEIRPADGAFTIYTASGTAQAIGVMGRGGYQYRIFRVSETAYDQTPVRLDASMEEKRRAADLIPSPAGEPLGGSQCGVARFAREAVAQKVSGTLTKGS